jgi:hypothetical protein
MQRRQFITLVGGTVIAWPLSARAQQDGQIPRIGFLAPDPDSPLFAASYPAFLAELRKLGFTEGKRLIEFRRADEGASKTFAAAAELIRSKADVVVTFGPEITLKAASAASQTIPIVMIAVNFDPIAGGYVSNIARPDRNITGLVSRAPELAAKQLELLVEAFPDNKPIAALWDRLHSSTPPNAPPNPFTASCVHIRSKVRHLISTRPSEPSRRVGRVCYWSCQAHHSACNVLISPIWRYSTACRQCSPSSTMSRRAG